MVVQRVDPAVILVVVVCVLIAVSALLLLGRKRPSVVENLSASEISFDSNDRVLVLAPHPDDEVLGCGGVIQHAVARGLPIRVVFLTYGDFYEWSFTRYKKHPVLTPRGVEGMGEVRHGEALAAGAVLGLSPDHLTFLGYPDFKTLDMWQSAWGEAPPGKGLLTRATAVPYADALRPGAPYKGEEVVKDLVSILRGFRPTKVFVSHPADHHPDHKALYLFTRVALFDLAEEISPRVYSYMVHYTQWPTPLTYRPDAWLLPPSFLRSRIVWQAVHLDAHQEDTKAAALKKHQTQHRTTPKFLDSFVRRNELFGDFPVVKVDVQTPPSSLQGADGSSGNTTVVGDQEAHLVGVMEWDANLEDGNLVYTIRLARPLAKEVGCSVSLFGYRSDTPFAQMPKLHVRFGSLTHRVYDQDREVAAEGTRVERSGRDIRVRVPLSLLGSPQKILSTARIDAGPVPLEWSAWHILEISDASTRED